MDFSSITSFFSNSVAKVQNFISGTENHSPPPGAAQASSSLNPPDPPQQVSRLKNLEQKLSDSFCEVSDYVKGFGRGINPVSSFTDPIQSSLKIEDSHCSDGKSFATGQMHGAAVGLAGDALAISTGATTDGLSFACEGVTAGACTLAAVPAMALGTTQIAAGAMMAVGHGANYLEASAELHRFGSSKESVRRLNRMSQEAENDPNTKIHGVSVSENKPTDGREISTAQKNEVEKYFKVHDTPKKWDTGHKTLELPKPVTQQITDLYNRLFGRIP
ncbi:MAG: hypothetical protein HQM15_08690 [Deltaproteobacteria bacterium]|nr:hypothetical protein [Deltaproteobacteria bacterium]